MSNTLICNCSSAYGAGMAAQQKLFRVQNGEHVDRLFALFARTPSIISYAVADPPYGNWSEPTDIITDAADYPVSGYLDENDCIFVVYTKQTSGDLCMVKLTYGGGSWSVGTGYTVYNGEDNYFPVIYKDLYSTLYVTWSRYTGSGYTVNAKTSVDEGQTWNTGPSDPGWQLSAEASSAYSTLVYRPTYVYCLYSLGGDKLALRKKDIYASVWDAEEIVYEGSGLYENFSARISADNRLAVTFSSASELYYKEHDGTSWSGLHTVDAHPALAPFIRFTGSVPYVVFGRSTGEGQSQWFSVHLETSGFTTPQPVLAGFNSFEAVYCYRAGGTPEFCWRTDEAANVTTADVFHSASGKLALAVGDAVYLGSDERFCRLSCVLSTTGAGGVIEWSFWDGSSWKTFTPASGGYHFDSSPHCVHLWDDLHSTPTDWQKLTINTRFKYWVRAVVTEAYTTAPIGSQLTAVANLDDAGSCAG